MIKQEGKPSKKHTNPSTMWSFLESFQFSTLPFLEQYRHEASSTSAPENASGGLPRGQGGQQLQMDIASTSYTRQDCGSHATQAYRQKNRGEVDSLMEKQRTEFASLAVGNVLTQHRRAELSNRVAATNSALPFPNQTLPRSTERGFDPLKLWTDHC